MAENQPPASEAAPGETALIDRAGNRVAVPNEYVEQALADPVAAYRVETPEEAKARQDETKYGDRTVAAATAGIARGVSLGLSDAALTGSGLVAPETLRGLKEHNEGASTAGEIAGAVGSLLIPGVGEGSIARGVIGAGELGARGVAAVVGTSLAGRATTAAVRGAIEGGLYGIGNAISDASLGDTQLTAEKLAASAGTGALLGIGGAGIGEALRSALEPVAGLAIKATDGLSEKISSKAEEQALKAAGYIQKDLKPLIRKNPALMSERARLLLDEPGVITPGATVGDVAERLQEKVDSYGQQIGDILKQADDERGVFDFKPFVARVRKEVLAPIENDPAMRRVARQLDSLLNGYEQLVDKEGPVSFSRANDLKGNLQGGINFGNFFSTGGPSEFFEGFKKKVQHAFLEEIDTQLEREVGSDLGSQFKLAKKKYGAFVDALDKARQGMARQSGNRGYSLTDYLLGSAGSSAGGAIGAAFGPGGIAAGAALGGAAGSMANKALRERGPALFANALDALAKSPVFDKLATGFEGFVRKGLQSGSVFGQYTPVLANAAARGAEDLLLTHAVMSERDEKYRDTMQAAGLDYTEPTAQVAQRAQALALMQGHLNGYDSAIQRNLDAFLNGGGAEAGIARAMRVGQMTLAKFRELSDTIQELASNPNALTDRIAVQVGPLQDHAPNVATALASTTSNAVAFLNSRLPKSDNPLQQVPALRRDWQPSDLERARFERYLRATVDPASVFDDLKHGTVTREAIEALQAVYPKLADSLRAQTMDAVTSAQKRLDYRKRVALGTWLGTPLDSSMAPPRLMAMQADYAAQPGRPSSPSGAQMKSPQFAMTETQRLEGK